MSRMSQEMGPRLPLKQTAELLESYREAVSFFGKDSTNDVHERVGFGAIRWFTDLGSFPGARF